MRHMSRSVLVLALGVAATSAGCASGDERATAPSRVDVPGGPSSASTRALGAAQDMTPVEGFDAYLCGFHFVNGDLGRQMEAHHYAQRLNDDFQQAVIFDGNDADAKLIGVEYVISERLFRTLPADEQRLWHSHGFEVSSGALIAPGLPAEADRALMTDFAPTYGKTWHLWHADRGDTLPIGAPALMMGFTATGQLDPALLQDRDDRFNVSSEAIRRDRATISAPAPIGNADAWQRGEVVQVELTTPRAETGAEQGK